MGNVGYYPGNDVAAMAETAGYTLSELQSDWVTDELLASLMQQYYEESLPTIVNPGQGTRPPSEVFTQTLVSGIGKDIAAAGEQIAESAKALGTGLVSTVKAIPTLVGAVPYVLLAAAALAVLYLTRRK